MLLSSFLFSCSTNGVYINHELIGKGNRRSLKHGDEIQLTLKKLTSNPVMFILYVIFVIKNIWWYSCTIDITIIIRSKFHWCMHILSDLAPSYVFHDAKYVEPIPASPLLAKYNLIKMLGSYVSDFSTMITVTSLTLLLYFNVTNFSTILSIFLLL